MSCTDGLDKSSAEKLCYRGEGNNSIVLANPETGNIYRFRKTSTPYEEYYKKTKVVLKELDVTNIFRKNVMVNLIGARFIPDMRIIEVNDAILLELDKQIYQSRPKYRRMKHIDPNYSQILLAPDATLLPRCYEPYVEGAIISIEIKPKTGFITRYASSIYPDIAAYTCRFCMLEFHPSKSKAWRTRSQYCPCDLFSGERKRMFRALHSLVRSPRVNMRVFKEDGSIVFNHETNSLDTDLPHFLYSPRLTFDDHLDDFLNLIIDVLLYDFCESGPKSKLVQCRFPISQMCAMHSSARSQQEFDNSFKHSTNVREDCVLGRILSAQMLGPQSIFTLKKPYHRVNAYLEASDIQWDWSRCLTSQLSSQTSSRLFPEGLLEDLQLVEDYLISLVAKDLSMIIAMQPAKANCPPHIPTVTCSKGDKYVFNIMVVDLDPKPFSKIEEHFILEDEIVKSFKNHHESPSLNDKADL